MLLLGPMWWCTSNEYGHVSSDLFLQTMDRRSFGDAVGPPTWESWTVLGKDWLELYRLA